MWQLRMADIQDVCGDRFSIGGLGVSMQLTYGKLVKQVRVYDKTPFNFRVPLYSFFSLCHVKKHFF